MSRPRALPTAPVAGSGCCCPPQCGASSKGCGGERGRESAAILFARRQHHLHCEGHGRYKDSRCLTSEAGGGGWSSISGSAGRGRKLGGCRGGKQCEDPRDDGWVAACLMAGNLYNVPAESGHHEDVRMDAEGSRESSSRGGGEGSAAAAVGMAVGRSRRGAAAAGEVAAGDQLLQVGEAGAGPRGEDAGVTYRDEM